MAQSPKFGRHIATIKYRFDISPLFITHVYPQDDKANWARGISTLLGVKSRMSVFHFDLHQRQQEMLKERPEMGETRKVFHKPFYEAEIDLGAIDLRTLAANFKSQKSSSFPPDGYDDDSHQDQNDVIFGDPSDCKIDDQDLEWYDHQRFRRARLVSTERRQRTENSTDAGNDVSAIQLLPKG
ncbi:hypothetical protein L7F22_020003 [Adiantum nelumboides]|nr:hypothetical protein [Adiantum nelumboides]